ncbi:MAG: 50S ribosomal protein L24 [Rickettsiales bacterium]|jgi:large subunit ribosomal protein L24|nr:50S ribosomal protein L24 [Rickettsiales bacterium]
MPKLKIKKNDDVIVIAGKDKGKAGKVLRAIPGENRVIVAGVNTVKKHQKADASGRKAGIVSKNLPIHASNVALADPKTGKPTRVGYATDKDGKKIRIAKRSGQAVK